MTLETLNLFQGSSFSYNVRTAKDEERCGTATYLKLIDDLYLPLESSIFFQDSNFSCAQNTETES